MCRFIIVVSLINLFATSGQSVRYRDGQGNRPRRPRVQGLSTPMAALPLHLPWWVRKQRRRAANGATRSAGRLGSPAVFLRSSPPRWV